MAERTTIEVVAGTAQEIGMNMIMTIAATTREALSNKPA